MHQAVDAKLLVILADQHADQLVAQKSLLADQHVDQHAALKSLLAIHAVYHLAIPDADSRREDCSPRFSSARALAMLDVIHVQQLATQHQLVAVPVVPLLLLLQPLHQQLLQLQL